MMFSTVHLGFEVGSGDSVSIPIKHMAVAGQTQESGKTTTLEALISRSGAMAITFITKRGEKSFASGRRIPPYFRERADWVFVASLIDATLGDKNKILRSWLMRVCRNTKTLAEVRANVKAAIPKARGMDLGIYTQIDGYLDLVVPQIRQLPPVNKVQLNDGLNVVDLSPYSSELQGLVIRSMIEHVYDHEDEVITVIPEAWEFLPQDRGSPVKLAAEELIRKGAGLKNYVWIDSQDFAGVWKLALRAAGVWLIGVQRESNELKRTLDNIPAGIAKPSKSDIAMLTIGQFFACWGRHVKKIYVQPAWMDEAMARDIAMGRLEIPAARQSESVAHPSSVVTKYIDEQEQMAHNNGEDMSQEDVDEIKTGIITISERLAGLAEFVQRYSAPTNGAPEPGMSPAATTVFGEEAYQKIKKRLIQEAPQILKVIANRPEIVVTIEREQVQIAGSSLRGRVAKLMATGFFKEGVLHVQIKKELERTGNEVNNGNLSRELTGLVAMGFLTWEEGKKYKFVPSMKVQILDAK